MRDGKEKVERDSVTKTERWGEGKRERDGTREVTRDKVTDRKTERESGGSIIEVERREGKRERERKKSCHQNYQLKHILVSPGNQNFHLPSNLFLTVTFLIAFRVF